MQNPKKLVSELLKMRPHFGSVGSWLMEPLSRATKHLRVGAGHACRIRTTALGQVLLRLGDSDFRTLLEISRGEYDICLKFLNHPRSILDLGANVGLSVRLWQIKFPEVRVVAIEPSAASAKLLRKNVDEGPFPQSVIVVQAAVNSDGRPEFLDQSGDSDSHQVGTAGTPVAGISIDDAILQAAGADGMVDLVKMDIEGSERCLMACASRWVPKVRYLLVEIHGSYTERLLERDLSVACAQWKALHVRSAPGVATYFVILNPDDCPLHRIP